VNRTDVNSGRADAGAGEDAQEASFFASAAGGSTLA